MSRCKQLGYYSNIIIQDDFFKTTVLTTLLSSSGILMALPTEQNSSSSLWNLRLPTLLTTLPIPVSVLLSNVCSFSQRILCTSTVLSLKILVNQSPWLLEFTF